MKALTLFKSTFQKTQQAIALAEKIKSQVLPTATKRMALQKIARTMTIFNSIEHNAMDLQTPQVDAQLGRFANFLMIKNMTASYDYEKKGFKLVSNPNFNEKVKKLSIHVRSQGVEKADHPLIRQSLYFHQLKDIQQIVKIKYPRNAPRFVRQLYRRNAQDQLLDKENPLGVPIKAPPLELLLQFNDLFLVQLYCRYGNINIKSIRMLRKQIKESRQQNHICDYMLDGMNIPRPIQHIFYDLVKNELKIDEPQLLLLHKIAYIGGRVQQLQFLFNMLQFYTASIHIP